MAMSEAVKQFLDYLSLERSYSQRTVDEYGRDLQSFELYFTQMDNQLSWATVDADVIRDWMESMMDRGNTATSINRRLSAVRSFYRFALKRRLVDHDPAHRLVGPKKQKPLPVFLQEQQMDLLLDKRFWTDSYDDTLARTLFIILYETGMRSAEVLGLDVDSVDRMNRVFKVTGKRNKQRLIPYGEELEGVLEDYLKAREALPIVNTEALLLCKKGTRLTKQQLYHIVRSNLAKVTTQKKRSPHVLRHTFATVMLNNEAGLQSVQRLLGHESLKTTEVYSHTTFEQLRKVYDKAHPRKE